MCDSDLIVRGEKREKIFPHVSLGELFLARLPLYESKTALVQKVDGRDVSVTYAELLRHGKSVAALLREHGVGSGDTVMLCCGNTLDFAPILLGTLFAAATLAPVNPTFDAADMVQMLDVLAPQLVICNQLAEQSVQKALAHHHTAVTCISMEAVNTCRTKDVTDFSPGHVQDPDTHVALVMCSSGTSGRPKGVEISHSTFIRRLESIMLKNFDDSDDEQHVLLNISGPFWVSAANAHSLGLLSGCKLVLLATFTATEFLDAIQRHKIYYAMLGPDQLFAISQFPSADKLYDLSSLRCVMVTGSSVSSHMLLLAEANIGMKIFNTYGLTEFIGMTPLTKDKGKGRTVGWPSFNIEAKISDVESGASLGANQRGELRVKGETVSKSYRGNPTASAQAFDEDGFLRTGDIAYYDDDGYFYIVGRIKESFKYKNIHVDTDDIEELLLRHPDVLEASVVGVDHELDCAHATAFIVRRPEADVTEQHLIQLVASTFPSYKWLHGGVYFLPALPRTATGKVRKFDLGLNYKSYIS